MKQVSVIVPVYRTQAWLDRCVESITRQTFADLEILLIDDGSPDDCPAICDRWAKKDARIRVLHKKNGGLMAAWMDGVRMSTGRYLCFVDSDDWIDACMVEELMKVSSGGGREILCGNYVQEEKKRRFCVIQPMPPGTYEGGALAEQLFGRLLGEEKRPVTLSRCMKLFSRELIEENLRWCDPAIVMAEDVNITLPAFLDARRVVLLEDACYYHYLYLRESMAHRYDAGLADNVERFCHAAENILREKGAPDWKGQLERERVLLTFLAMKNELRGKKPGWRRRLQEICTGPQTAQAAREYPPKLETWGNRLLFFALRHPGPVIFQALGILFWAYGLRCR